MEEDFLKAITQGNFATVRTLLELNPALVDCKNKVLCAHEASSNPQLCTWRFGGIIWKFYSCWFSRERIRMCRTWYEIILSQWGRTPRQLAFQCQNFSALRELLME